MTIASATRIAREFGLHLVRGHGNTFVLIEASYIKLTPARAARISPAEWRVTCSQVVYQSA